MKNISRMACILAGSLVASGAGAFEATCKSGNVERHVSVEYEHKGWKVPCRVKYEKPAQDMVEYPWNAQAQAGYCEDRAEFLVKKLENWGWQCTRTTGDSTTD